MNRSHKISKSGNAIGKGQQKATFDGGRSSRDRMQSEVRASYVPCTKVPFYCTVGFVSFFRTQLSSTPELRLESPPRERKDIGRSSLCTLVSKVQKLSLSLSFSLLCLWSCLGCFLREGENYPLNSTVSRGTVVLTVGMWDNLNFANVKCGSNLFECSIKYKSKILYELLYTYLTHIS